KHIFLTGKAGTGKTTFLRNLGKNTHKSFLIVAPTGIAALNAGGVTIHSQFLLPPGTFLPDRNPEGIFGSDGQIITQHTLLRNHPMSGIRKQVLKGIDLLVIDEVSMLRADVLDAIDFRMRHAKRRYDMAFGGVQLLLIGDLYQLPPVVKEQEWNFLRRYYRSIWFYEARALQSDGFVYLELEKIFRQQDDVFIGLLNRLRDNAVTREDILLLNQHVKPESEIRQLAETITLTTHNYKADELNRVAMDALPGESGYYQAEIEGDFPPQIYPVAESLELKIGAQIMFIKNDTEQGMYYNGKLARVVKLGESVEVELADSKVRYVLRREKWENKRYKVNQATREVEEDVIGTFVQFPIRPAWAITVHKSQGLTFDRAVIDVGQAFAAGQVYVALSRLRSLDGLILRTPISSGVVSTDEEIVSFSRRRPAAETLMVQLKDGQGAFLKKVINDTFDFSTLLAEINRTLNDQEERPEFEDEHLRTALPSMKELIEAENNNTLRFRTQLNALMDASDWPVLSQRLEKGSVYYRDLLLRLSKTLIYHRESVRVLSGNKGYIEMLDEIDMVLSKNLRDVLRCGGIADAVISDDTVADSAEVDKWMNERVTYLEEARKISRAIYREPVKKTGRKRKPKSGTDGLPKEPKKPTHLVSLELFRSGLKPEEIAKQRMLVPSTIHSHLAKCVGLRLAEVNDFVEKHVIEALEPIIVASGSTNASDIFQLVEAKYEYTTIRYLLAHLRNFEESGSE
ncbi:MAG: helix-turn-helix domain-containing protein, partial [Flavobacteriales bacterium]|nr:helix-turn-helix domain-containing protein [Flavobacteriales bacterium]